MGYTNTYRLGIIKITKQGGNQMKEDMVLIKKDELAELNKLILELLDIEDYTKRVQEDIRELVLNFPEDYIDENFEAEIDEDIVDNSIERVWEYDTEIPSVVYEEVHERIWDMELDEIQDELQEIANEWKIQEEYGVGLEAEFRKRGLRMKDFY